MRWNSCSSECGEGRRRIRRCLGSAQAEGIRAPTARVAGPGRTTYSTQQSPDRSTLSILQWVTFSCNEGPEFRLDRCLAAVVLSIVFDIRFLFALYFWAADAPGELGSEQMHSQGKTISSSFSDVTSQASTSPG
jgi:hypothetical protein